MEKVNLLDLVNGIEEVTGEDKTVDRHQGVVSASIISGRVHVAGTACLASIQFVHRQSDPQRLLAADVIFASGEPSCGSPQT
ncbi:MAG: hypothetical protein ISS55_04830 [Dehalococcoidales bacterium]|nr:hypothetical protein [Dehalococcoidales bacterium]